MIGLSAKARADNPIVQIRFTADPAALVRDGVVSARTLPSEDDAASIPVVGGLQYRYVPVTPKVRGSPRC